MEQAEPIKITEDEIDRFLDEEKITSDYYKYILNKFRRSKGELSEGAVRDFVDSYDKKNSQNTALSTLRSLAEWKRGKIPPMGEDNQLKRWTLEKIMDMAGETTVARVEQKAVPLDELGEILQSLDGPAFSGVWCLFYYGVRPGELVALEPSMIGDGSVVFETEKTKVERELPFDEFTGEHLNRFVDSGFGYQFLYRRCKEQGITPKAGRRTFITEMQRTLADADFEPVLISSLVKLMAGHTVSGDITSIYTDYTDDIREAFLEFHYLDPVREGLGI